MPEENALGIGTEHTVDEDISFLGEGEEIEETEETTEEIVFPEDKEKEEKVGTKKEETKEEVKEEEKETETEETVSPFQRTSFKQVEEKYPNFFKDFPDLRHAIGREAAFAQIYPTVEDAKEAKESSEDYNYLRDEILQGKVETLFSSVKEADPNSYKKVVDNFLPKLYETDREAFFGITEPLIANTIANIYKGSNDENVQNAALVIAKQLFGSYDVAKNPSLILKAQPPTKSAEKEDLEKERQQFQLDRLRVMQGEVETDLISTSKSRLMGKIFDSKDRITEDAKEVWVEKAFKELDRLLGSSQEHKAIMNSLWKKALQNGMTGYWKDRIKSTYLSRAESLMPTIRAKVRKMAFGVQPLRTKRETSEVSREENSNGNRTSKKDYSQMSDLDIINEE